MSQCRPSRRLQSVGCPQVRVESFVCEGEYEHWSPASSTLTPVTGTERRSLLSGFPGFYGGGKSHLVAFCSTCADTNTATSRGLANTRQVSDQLTDWTTLGRRGRHRGRPQERLTAAATPSTRYFSIVLRAAGLPRVSRPLMVALWLADNGHLDAVREHIVANDGDIIEELAEYHLSRLANAILAVDPEFASSAKDVRGQLSSQFPTSARSFSTDETVELLKKILQYAGDGHIPPSLIVLDEVQQYISGDGGRAMEVQNLVESVSRELDGRYYSWQRASKS